METLILKLLTFPFILFIAHLLFRGVEFGSFPQIGIWGIILAIASYYADFYLLGERVRASAFSAALADAIIVAVLIWIVQLIFFSASITLLGAVYAGILFAGVEFFIHSWLIKNKMIRWRNRS
ncbi:MAG TPA: DUF2512 family protein [Clostridia bacterium]|jgi:hypothetical protein|nr:DUF2512 family protein [Clostridia bacterium]